MILPVHDHLRAHLSHVLHSRYGLQTSQQPTLALEYPPTRALGDLGTPVAFELARRLRKAPRVIAQQIADALGRVPRVTRVVAAPNGYLNFFLDRAPFLIERLRPAAASPAQPGKAIVEHTAINPNKAAHVGHLRNATLGDTLVRALRFRGTRVEVQNYIDDTGVQVADVVTGFRHLAGHDLEAVRAIADSTAFDYHCWDLYSRVTEWYEQDKERLAIRAKTLHDIEHGDNDNAEMAAFIADRIVRCHLKTMARMNVDYDLLTWEGDILRLKFWAQAFERLKETGAVHLRTEGRLAGCWVMPIEDPDLSAPATAIDGASAADDAPVDTEEPVAEPGAEPGVEPAAEEREKVIVRSNGVVTYVGKDIAYQFWKLGLLGLDFHYRAFVDRPSGPLWATCTPPGDTPHPPFGGATFVYNVIDVRQSYLQQLLKQALIAVGHPDAAERSQHFSYEMVALSHATARELGCAPPPESDAARKPFVEVSGRKGLGVKADDLLDTLLRKAVTEVGTRNPELTSAETDRVAQMIAVAAVRYFLIKFSRGKVIAFDLEEAMSFQGESGPYVQYAVVRINNIFRKLQDRDGLDEATLLAALDGTAAGELDGDGGGHELWALVLEASRLDEIVAQVVATLEFSVLAKYAFGLAQAFNAFYNLPPQRSSILNEEREEVRRWRAAGTIYVRDQLTRALGLMGIDVPARM
jgi:arginyl-tRNA synthetase